MTSKKNLKMMKIRKLFKSYGSNDDKFKNDRTLSFVITRSCNLKCKFCIWNKQVCDRQEFIALDVFETALIKGKELNYQCVSLTGGEAILHPQFKEIIDLIIKYNYKFTLVSNGLLWESYKFLVENDNIRKHFDSMAFSLDGRKEIHDKYRCSGSFDKVIEAINFFKDKIHLTIKMAIGKHNYTEIMEVLKIADSLQTDIEIFSVTCMRDFVLKSEDIDSINKIIESNVNLFLKYSNKIKITLELLEISSLDFCGFLKSRGIDILPNGDCSFCCGIDYPPFIIGNIKEDSIFSLLEKKFRKTKQIVKNAMEIMLDPLIMGIYVKDKCSICKWALGCQHDPEEVMLHYPPEYLKQREQEIKSKSWGEGLK